MDHDCRHDYGFVAEISYRNTPKIYEVTPNIDCIYFLSFHNIKKIDIYQIMAYREIIFLTIDRYVIVYTSFLMIDALTSLRYLIYLSLKSDYISL